MRTGKYICFVCGSKLPKKMMLNTSYGDVCLGCAHQVYNVFEQNNENFGLLFNHSWRGPIANSMTKEIHTAYKQLIENQDDYECFAELLIMAQYILLDINEESGRWKNQCDEVIDDYVESFTIYHKEFNFNQKEMKIVIKNILQFN